MSAWGSARAALLSAAIALTQAGCGLALAGLTYGPRDERRAIGLDDRDGQLVCAGAPCREAPLLWRTQRPSPAATYAGIGVDALAGGALVAAGAAPGRSDLRWVGLGWLLVVPTAELLLSRALLQQRSLPPWQLEVPVELRWRGLRAPLQLREDDLRDGAISVQRVFAPQAACAGWPAREAPR